MKKITDNLNILPNRYIYPLVFIFFLLFWSFVLIGSGSVFSGYHNADDHQIVAIHNDLVSMQSDIIKVTKKWIIDDPTRFKPLYYLYRVIETRIFGGNFTLRLIFNGLLAVFASFFLFLFSRKIGFSWLESILFPILSLVGLQAVIWWSSGINEAISMVLLSLSLVFMSFGIYSKERKFTYELLFTIFAILVSLSKESFLLILPALVFWKIWLYKERNAVLWLDSIKRNMLPTVILLFVMFTELFIIVKWIGTKPFGNAGAGFDILKPLLYLMVAKDMTLSISTIGLGLIILTGVFLVVIFGANNTKDILSKITDFSRDFLYPFILFVLIIAPQVIIYSRSGFAHGRYILPLILGYSVFLIYLLRFLRINREMYFIKLPNKNVKWFFLLGNIVGLFLVSVGVVFVYSQEMRELLFSTLGRPNFLEIGDISAILKPVALSVLSGAFIIFCAWIMIKKSDRKLAIVNIILSLTILTIFYKTTLFFAGAYGYALEGRRYYWLQQSVKTNTKQNDIILIVADPIVYMEPGYLTKVYLNNTTKRKRIYVHYMSLNDDHNSDEGIRIEDKGKDVDYIAILGGLELEQKLLSNSKDWFDSSNFNRETNDLLIIYYKKS